MVYIHFPNNLTEEEQMLQAKYQKLKKKVSNGSASCCVFFSNFAALFIC